MESLKSLRNSILVIIRASLTTSHDSGSANILRAFKVEHSLRLAHVSFEVSALVNFTWITINEVVLSKIKHSEKQALI